MTHGHVKFILEDFGASVLGELEEAKAWHGVAVGVDHDVPVPHRRDPLPGVVSCLCPKHILSSSGVAALVLKKMAIYGNALSVQCGVNTV